jgi:hypothetical protein
LEQIQQRFAWERIPEILMLNRYAAALILLGYIMHFFPDRHERLLKHAFVSAPSWVKALCLSGILLLIDLLRSTEFQPFIYFQF